MSIATWGDELNDSGVQRIAPQPNLARLASTIADTVALAALYDEVGGIRGRWATREGRRDVAAELCRAGVDGFMFVVERVAREPSEDALLGATDLLVALLNRGDPRLWRTALAKLDSGPAAVVAEILLAAVCRSDAPITTPGTLSAILCGFASHPDVSVRDNAVRAAERLPDPAAVLRRFADDPDPFVQEALAELRERSVRREREG